MFNALDKLAIWVNFSKNVNIYLFKVSDYPVKQAVSTPYRCGYP
jgi:hypothetical protein